MKIQNKTRKLLIGLLMAGLAVLPSIAMAQEEPVAAPAPVPVPTITTDQQDYAPWELVTIHGSGFEPDSAIVLTMVWPDGWVDGFSGTADSSGAFTAWYGKEKYEGTFTVTATDTAGNTATTTFTDAANVNTTTTLDAIASPLLAGQTGVSFSGTVSVGTGDPAVPAGSPVRLQYALPPGGYADIASTTTGTGGSFSGTFTAPAGGATYSFRAWFDAVSQTTTVGTDKNGHPITLTINWQQSHSDVRTVVVNSADTKPPVTTLTILTGTVGSDSWYISDVQVQLTAIDPDSGKGVDKIYYKLNSGADTTYSDPFWISTEGTTTVDYWAVDKATPPNTEPVNTTTIKIDKTAINNASVTINDGALYTSSTSVTLALEAHDAVGGVSEYDITDGSTNSTGNDAGGVADFVLASKPWTLPDGDGTKTVTVSYYDVGGNPSVSPSDSIVLDTQGPTVTFDPSLTPPASGWFTTPQTSTVTAAEVENCIVVSLDLLNDGSGRLPGTLTGVTGLQSRSASGTVTAATDGLYTIICKATDGAGNPGQATVMFGIDTAPPVTGIVPSGTPGSNGWYRSDVGVTLTATDSGSGVKEIHYILNGIETLVPVATATFSITVEATNTLVYWAVDNAGNEETHHSEQIKIDKTPPTISGATTTSANSNGWWKTDVTVHFTASDSGSGIDTVTPDTVVSTEASGQSVTGTAVDEAGNSASATVSGINVDKTAPAVSFVGASGTGDLGSFLLGASATATWKATDNLSGIDGSATGTIALVTSSIGSKTVTAPTVYDKAGNASAATNATYSVIYKFGGILQPIDADGKSIFKLGSTVPVKFQLRDANGNFVTNAIANIKVQKFTGAILGDDVEAVSTSAATTGTLFRYDLTSNQYIFNLATRPLSTGTWQITITLNDGTTQCVNISLR